MDDSDLTFENKSPRVYSVTALTEQIKILLEDHFDFIWVEAEISNFRKPSSGHFYMGLKDEGAQIRAVMFRPQTRYLRFTPEDGMKVVARGRIGVYQPRGEYQIILDYLEPLGIGALALAFEQLKKKLAAQGIFDDEIKRPLPFLPRSLAVRARAAEALSESDVWVRRAQDARDRLRALRPTDALAGSLGSPR